ncbi:MAG: dUTP diphosphatase, partial [Paenibacillaceae bacterium]|nr:dUTP diphosphatase [Paenibacillaceae bacterium]
MSFEVQINRLAGNEDIELPRKMSELASGFDLYAAVTEELTLLPGQRALVPTGIAIAMPGGL